MFKNIDAYVEALGRALRDGHISDIESAELRRLATVHKLNEKDFHKANVKAATIYADFYIRDGFLDDQEETHLRQILTALGLVLDHLDPRIADAVRMGKQMQSVSGGQLPVVHQSQVPVAVSPTETVHLYTNCSIFEDRVVARKTVGGSAGVRFRVCKGVSVGVGGFRGTSVPITQNLRVSSGPLLLTSYGARYMGSAKGFQKPWNKIAGVDPCSDGVVFFFSDRANPTVLQYEDRRVAPIVEAITIALLR